MKAQSHVNPHFLCLEHWKSIGQPRVCEAQVPAHQTLSRRIASLAAWVTCSQAIFATETTYLGLNVLHYVFPTILPHLNAIIEHCNFIVGLIFRS